VTSALVTSRGAGLSHCGLTSDGTTEAVGAAVGCAVVLMSMSSGSDAVEMTGSAATGCTTGAEVFGELGSGGVFAAGGSGDSLPGCEFLLAGADHIVNSRTVAADSDPMTINSSPVLFAWLA
jgi:hypothetical protein